MKRTSYLCAILVVLFAQGSIRAWSGPGHAAVAVMAYRELAANPALRTKLTDLLKGHPAFNAWKQEFDAKKSTFPAGLDLGMFLFIRASTWPDAIRGTHDPKLKPFDHPNWHFVDYPLTPPTFATGPSPAPADDVLFGIAQSAETLANKNAARVQRAASLSWLIHLVGDLHQPLHGATLISAGFPAPDGDRGGNKFLIVQNAEQKKHKQTTKLHSFWDGRLGADQVPDPVQAVLDAKMLKATHARSSLSELSAGDDVTLWSFESRDEAVKDVYRFKNTMLVRKAVLPFGYVTASHVVARRRLALAGYRLSDQVKKVGF